ncbi:CobW family GTP-binding protein [Phaeobacter inhibens]|uniref:CobW family GTP-binding protein n=1 Tax=Phaeobacter inhibens TaxID=221822 RepID=UPI0021A66FE3|nr:GTP-binding protein [Phaeobacter inhibens]UWR59215.1 GTP-binding protein [Phaeobacter inhibens]
MDTRVPVTLIAGFLGSGKTTLINTLLQGEHGLNITVLVNDFGAVNIDADLILKREREVMELSNGCVCCSIQSDLVAQLQALFRSGNSPEYLLIEASGVSQPGRIASVFGYPQLRNYARLDVVVTLLDAENTDMLSDNCQQQVQAQIEAADIAVLTKTDLVDAQRVGDFRER